MFAWVRYVLRNGRHSLQDLWSCKRKPKKNFCCYGDDLKVATINITSGDKATIII